MVMRWHEFNTQDINPQVVFEIYTIKIEAKQWHPAALLAGNELIYQWLIARKT